MGLNILFWDAADGLNVFCMNCVMHTLNGYETGHHDYTVINMFMWG